MKSANPRASPELDAMEFLNLVKDKIKLLELNEDLLRRSVNEGFSGGEKKRNEIFQMAVLEPRLAILDETDSGLDIDALRIVAGGVNKLKRPDSAQLVITHYQRLLNFIIPDFVHVLYDGRIVKSGDKQLALELEAKGYDWITKAAVTAETYEFGRSPTPESRRLDCGRRETFRNSNPAHVGVQPQAHLHGSAFPGGRFEIDAERSGTAQGCRAGCRGGKTRRHRKALRHPPGRPARPAVCP